MKLTDWIQYTISHSACQYDSAKKLPDCTSFSGKDQTGAVRFETRPHHTPENTTDGTGRNAGANGRRRARGRRGGATRAAQTGGEACDPCAGGAENGEAQSAGAVPRKGAPRCPTVQPAGRAKRSIRNPRQAQPGSRVSISYGRNANLRGQARLSSGCSGPAPACFVKF